MATSQQISLTVTETEAGERLDRILSQRFHDVSRARFQRLIAEGHVRVNGETIIEARHRVLANDRGGRPLRAGSPRS